MVNALSSERYGLPSRRDNLTIGKTHRSPTLVHPIVRHVFHATVHCLEARMRHRFSYHEGHEEHEAIRARSVRCHIAVPARGVSEPRSHNRSFDSAARRIPSSCSSCSSWPSWWLQRSPVVNALSGEQGGAPERAIRELEDGKVTRSRPVTAVVRWPQ